MHLSMRRVGSEEITYFKTFKIRRNLPHQANLYSGEFWRLLFCDCQIWYPKKLLSVFPLFLIAANNNRSFHKWAINTGGPREIKRWESEIIRFHFETIHSSTWTTPGSRLFAPDIWQMLKFTGFLFTDSKQQIIAFP